MVASPRSFTRSADAHLRRTKTLHAAVRLFSQPLSRGAQARSSARLSGLSFRRSAAWVGGLLAAASFSIGLKSQTPCAERSPCRISVTFDQNGVPSPSRSITLVPGDRIRIKAVSTPVFAKHRCEWEEEHTCWVVFTCKDKHTPTIPIERVTYAIAAAVAGPIPTQVLGDSNTRTLDVVAKRPGTLILGRREDAELPQEQKPNPRASCSRSIINEQLNFDVIIR